ncbi:MAG: TetR/AcrR family transcriptional regulator [Myxococcales bacterium]|nr:TetR/AcrR family transcriptional regulator [Myxococcales bacterium]
MTDDRRHSDAPPMIGVRDRQREETHRRLYECSLTVFRRDTFTDAKIDDIAKMAGVSRGTFYFHFPTKDDVLLELLYQVESTNLAAINALPEETPLERVLEVFLDSMAAAWQNEPKLLADTAIVGLRSRATGGLDRDADIVRGALGQRFVRAGERGEFDFALPPGVLSDFFLMNSLAASVGWTGAPDLPLRTVLEGTLQIFLHGVKHPSKR